MPGLVEQAAQPCYVPPMKRSEILILTAALTAPIVIFMLIFIPGALPGLMDFVSSPDIAPLASAAAVIVLVGILVFRRLPRRRPPPGAEKQGIGGLLRPPKRDVDQWRNEDLRNEDWRERE
jgi:hypothetical protein